MAMTLVAMSIAQMVIPVIALIIWKAGWVDVMTDPASPHPPFHPGVAPVFGLNAAFALLWGVSAGLYRKAAQIEQNVDAT